MLFRMTRKSLSNHSEQLLEEKNFSAKKIPLVPPLQKNKIKIPKVAHNDEKITFQRFEGMGFKLSDPKEIHQFISHRPPPCKLLEIKFFVILNNFG